MKTILAPIDFSGATESVLDQAKLLARAFDARVVLLTVIQPPKAIAEYAPLLPDIAEITLAGDRAAANQLAELQDQMRAHSITCETVQLVGAPIANILAEADRTDAEYIVMGSHGHTAFYDLLVGSTTHGVLSRAKCPVIVIPAAATKRKAKDKEANAVAL
jgi:nucleotide-binding universal stress UspA family protein